MAVTAATLQLAAELRVTVTTLADDAVRSSVEAWTRAWGEIAGEFTDAITDLLLLANNGRWPSRRQVERADRARQALLVAAAQLDRLADQTKVTVTDAAGRAVTVTAQAQSAIAQSQLPPPSVASPIALGFGFTQISQDAITAIVQRTTQQIEAVTRPLSRDAVEAMRGALVRGVTVGDNPRRAAADMLARVRGSFNGGLTRALTIARTEILDAHRAGAKAGQAAMSDVLAGWTWQAQLDRRTCPSCWAMHGTRHSLDEDGPNDHQQGRCTRLPITKTWRELGFNIPEPASVLPDAQATFAALPRTTQLDIMGPARLALLDAGRVNWPELSQVRSTTGWRDSHAPTPVRDLTSAAA